MIIDKKNGECLYNDEKHVYWNENDNEKYVSVTTLIHKYCQEFDEEFWSSYKALQLVLDPDVFSSIKSGLLKTKKFRKEMIEQLGLEQDVFNDAKNQILKEWEDKKNTACERGTNIHLGKELEFYKAPEHSIEHFGLGGKFVCKRDHYGLDLEKGIYPEYLVSYKDSKGILRIAGQIDLFIKDGNDIYIIDYKTNKKLDNKSYFDPKTKKHQMMKAPLGNIMDCNMMHYTLQLSTYAYLLQRINPEFNVKQLMIIHYDHDGNEAHYELEYKKAEVELMLKHFKKSTILQQRKDSRKPIEY